MLTVTFPCEFSAHTLAVAAANSENRSVNHSPRALNVRPNDAAVPAVALESAFDFASAEYRALHANSRATVFQSPAWLDALHRDVAPAFGAEQATVTARDQGGRLMFSGNRSPALAFRRSGAPAICCSIGT